MMKWKQNTTIWILSIRSDFSAVLVLDNKGLHWTDPSGTEHIGMWDVAKHYNDKNKKVTMVTLTIKKRNR